MGQPAAKQGDQVVATDTHIVMVPTPSGAPVEEELDHPFTGVLNAGLSPNVRVTGMPAAMVDSTADNLPPHVPTYQGSAFKNPPSNKATIKTGSTSVFINRKPAARHGDKAMTCNDPVDLLAGDVIATGKVSIGG